MSVLVLKSHWLDSEREGESWLICFNCFLITCGCKCTLALPFMQPVNLQCIIMIFPYHITFSQSPVC